MEEIGFFYGSCGAGFQAGRPAAGRIEELAKITEWRADRQSAKISFPYFLGLAKIGDAFSEHLAGVSAQVG